MFGIEHRKIVESQGKIWRDGEHFLVGVASCIKMFLLLVESWRVASVREPLLFFSTKALSFAIASSCLFEAT